MAIGAAATYEGAAAQIEHVLEPDQVEEERVVAAAGEDLDVSRPSVDDQCFAEASRAPHEVDVVGGILGSESDPHLL
jgi:hypothetical protein